MQEIISKRKSREKHFLNSNGTISVHMYNEAVHYLKNGKWVDIDNTLIDKGEFYKNKSNDFETIFTKESNDLVNVKKGKYYLKIFCKGYENLKLRKVNDKIEYNNLKSNIDIFYKLKNNSLKESILLNCKETIPDCIDFIVDTNLFLKLREDNKIEAFDENQETIFIIDSPYMIDATRKANHNIKYILENQESGIVLKLNLDKNWLKSEETIFPVMIDPTIINGTGENVYDTYISKSEPDKVKNAGLHNKLGADKSGIYRSLLKFDLPKIGTGCSIVNATAYLKTMDSLLSDNFASDKPITVHNINSEWKETTATWNNMNNKFDSLIETWFQPAGYSIYNIGEEAISEIDLTSIVKKWYSGTPNYGVMLKLDEEIIDQNYEYPYLFYSKSYDYEYGTSNRPYLIITYLYQNGILPYMDYNDIELSTGESHINNCNGNITNEFRLNKVIHTNFPFIVSAIYNTCDVVLNSVNNIAKGWKFNFYETLKFDNVLDALVYVDENSSIHYFYADSNGIYEDEEGLKLKIEFKNNQYVMLDHNGNQKIYALVSNEYKLIKVIDVAENEILITYNNGNITSIKNNNEQLDITYFDDKITISGTFDSATINLTNNQIASINNKFGNVMFEYESNNLISKITDVNGVSYNYEYYSNIPYRIKKVSVYSSNNTLLKTVNYNYGYLTTTIIDSNNMKTVYTFNVFGNTLGTVIYDNNSNDLKEAYGFSNAFVNDFENPQNSNNLSSESIPIKYVNNLIVDSSFENSDGNNILENRVKQNARTGAYSCYFTKEYEFFYNIIENKDYTFSFYIKSAYNGNVFLYKNNNGNLEEISSSKMLENTDTEYMRYFITGTFEAGSTLDVKVILDDDGDGYIDDIQLEEGKIANHYNLIDNSAFMNDFAGWDVANCELVTLNNNIKAARIIGEPSGDGSGLSKYLNISGKAGDTYNLSFWYKNEGVLDTDFEFIGNMANIAFYTDDEFGGTCTMNLHLNKHASEWQFFNGYFTAETDYTDMGINVLSIKEANSLYITNVMLIKESGTYNYQYDENGNLIQESDLEGNVITNIYDKNNQIVSKTIGNGTYTYEYDSVVTDRKIRGISPNGMSIENVYDKNGNQIKEIISNPLSEEGVVGGLSYYIRLKGTKKYLKYDLNNKIFIFKEDDCNHSRFELKTIKTHMFTYFKLLYQNRNMIVDNTNLKLSEYEPSEELDNVFIMQKNDNGTITLKHLETDLVLTCINDKLVLAENENLDSQQFYFENVRNNKRIISETIYDENNKFVTKKIDSLGKVTSYVKDPVKGLELAVTNPRGITTKKEYTTEDLLSKISINNREINYQYNDNKLLSKILLENEEYTLDYDEMMNLSKVKINDNEIVSKNYDSNNRVTKINFANGNEIEYKYDKFSRISDVVKSNKNYKYYYDNFSSLAKIEAQNEVYDFIYDKSQKLHKFTLNNNFICKYNYNKGKLIRKNILVDEKEYNTNYIYDNNENLISTSFDSSHNLINTYDELNRLIKETVNGEIPIEYHYKENGDNTSVILDTIIIDNNLYKYKYDGEYNITEVYLNGNLKNKYLYDEYNELILEIDYDLQQKVKYKYDKNGNILSKMVCKLDDTLISLDKFEYSNQEWKDQLTKFNDIIITYDALGNPIRIGNKEYSWINGTQIDKYKNGEKEVNFEYNYGGQLFKKTNGNDITNYYYSGSLLTVEKRNNNMLYYIYDGSEKLIGLKYNDNLYFYQRNQFDDITGIYDENYNLIVKYKYDSWGNVLSITDASNNDITDDSNIGIINPFRYRSYYYDKDIELYIFQERYYNPKICRFFNIDKQIGADILGANLYVYCGNNPINRTDDEGKGFFTKIFAGALIGAAVSSVVKVASNVVTGKEWHEGIGKAAIEGAVTGALTAGLSMFGGKGSALISTAGSASIVSAAKVGYSIGKDYGSGKKEPTVKNIVKSVAGGAVKVTTDTGLAILGSSLSDSVAKELGIIDVGRPAEKFLTMLFGKKAMKNTFKDLISSTYEETTGSLIDYMYEEVQPVISLIF